MAKYYFKTSFILMIGILLIGCAGEKVMKPAPSFNPYHFDAAQYTSKVESFEVILDISFSMSEKYDGRPKAEIAKNFLTAMNETLPELKYSSTLRTFGHESYFPYRSTMRVYGVKPYSTTEFGSAINAVKGPGGNSSIPLAEALTAAGEDLNSVQGPIAIIIVSDGEEMDQSPITAAKALQSRFGDRLCIDTVQVGDYPGGKAFLEQLAKVSGCGFSTTADKLAASSDMAGFVESIFLAKHVSVAALDSDGDGVPDDKDKCPNTPRGVKVDAFGCPLDTDQDGVPDYLDKCPNTPKGATVDARGCWSYASVVLFDLNSAEVKSEAYPMLNDAVLIMKKNPDLKVRIDGYTDSTGTEAYNLDLSERRAEAVKDFFISRGIAPERITTKGFGIANPVASNKTKEGRAKNRRVEFTPGQ
jgi:OmpA-OmpF porin, OOP family